MVFRDPAREETPIPCPNMTGPRRRKGQAMNPRIFREYDLRGLFGRDFDIHDAEIIGRGFGTCLNDHGGRRVVVGRDCRLSSPEIKDALATGLARSGIQVTDIGVCTTPLVYFSLHHLEVDGGVMITASHNPADHNGFKLCLGRDNLYGQQIRDLWKLIETGRFAEGRGSIFYKDISKYYTDYLIHNLNISRPVKAAMDAGNGTAGALAGPVFRALGQKPAPLYFDMDGRFPHHPADPTIEENMADLARTVVENGLELGIGFDGDGDRIAVVDETGRLIPGDRLLMLFAREVLKDHPGATVIGDVKCSHLLYEDIRRHGGRPVMWKSGHSLIKQKMKEEKAILAGEMSGHICFTDRYFGIDDAVYNAGRLLEIVAGMPGPLSEYWSDLPLVFSTPEIREPCPEEMKFELVKRLKDKLAPHYRVNDIDGVRIDFPDGWALVRASNTGPIMVKRFEAASRERLSEIQALIESTLEAVQ